MQFLDKIHTVFTATLIDHILTTCCLIMIFFGGDLRVCVIGILYELGDNLKSSMHHGIYATHTMRQDVYRAFAIFSLPKLLDGPSITNCRVALSGRSI